MTEIIQQEVIESKIFLIRGHKVMLDSDLADLYGVETKYLTRQVRRNNDRFPDDFMFLLTRKEVRILRCQIGTLRHGKHTKYLPYAFTDYGILMLSTVLNSERAIQVNIAIIRTFVKLRRILASNAELAHKLDELEKKYDHQFKVVFDAIRELMKPPKKPPRRIGFH